MTRENPRAVCWQKEAPRSTPTSRLKGSWIILLLAACDAPQQSFATLTPVVINMMTVLEADEAALRPWPASVTQTPSPGKTPTKASRSLSLASKMWTSTAAAARSATSTARCFASTYSCKPCDPRRRRSGLICVQRRGPANRRTVCRVVTSVRARRGPRDKVRAARPVIRFRRAVELHRCSSPSFSLLPL